MPKTKPESRIDQVLREFGEACQYVFAQYDRQFPPVPVQTRIRRAQAERRMREAEAAFNAEEAGSPMPNSLDPRHIERIRKLYTDGIKREEIARLAHVDVKTVHTHTLDLPRRRPAYPPLSAEAVTELYALLDQGKTLAEVANTLGISVSTAHRYRKRRQAT